MNALNDHVFAVKLGAEQLTKGKIWLYIVPSLAVGLLFFSIFSIFGSITESASVVKGLPLIGDYIAAGVEKTMGIFDWIAKQFYIFFVLTLLSPVNCMLSEKIDNEVTGAKFDGGIMRIMTDIMRAILILIFSLMLNFLVMVIWWFLAWITGFHALDGIVYFLIGAFFVGFSFYDFNLERYGIGFFGTVEFGFERVAYMLLTGVAFSLIYMLPVVGLLLAPFLITIVSTIVYVKMNNKIPNKQTTNGIQP